MVEPYVATRLLEKELMNDDEVKEILKIDVKKASGSKKLSLKNRSAYNANKRRG